MKKTLTLHLISEATGQTLNAVARACITQFPNTTIKLRHWNLIRTSAQLQRVIHNIASEPGPVMSSLMDPVLQAELKTGCTHLGIRLLNVLDNVLLFLTEQTEEEATLRPGSQYIMDENYHQRIEAMHYVIAHDDGQQVSGLDEADVILIGVSRVSKTPTCFYLANRGIKAANVPLIMGIELPKSLLTTQKPVIGLTIDPERLVEIRRSRLSQITHGKHYSTTEDTYINFEKVKEELLWVRKLCRQHHWPIIDVTHRSIEESSTVILDILESHSENTKKSE